MKKSKVIVVGGGLAGLTAAIHLSKKGYFVTLFEKNNFPKHKVCGEYISNEVLPYLKSLDLDIDSLQAKHIDRLSFSLVSGKIINANLPLGGFGISRYTLDNYLYTEAKKTGVTIIQETVSNIDFLDDEFQITTNKNRYTSKVVLGAFGKRSNLDVKFERNFIQKKTHWLAVKAHYDLDFPDGTVGLHHFKGGYCGVSMIEDNKVNICYLANYETFKKYKSIEEYQEKVIYENPNLKQIFKKASIQFEKPLTISQISFDKKECVEKHILMIGDTAGLIHPLCGNGMAMAIHSAKLASEVIINFFENKISRIEMESIYVKNWNLNFRKRLQIGRYLGTLLEKETLAHFAMKIIILFPFILPLIIKKTHGKPI